MRTLDNTKLKELSDDEIIELFGIEFLSKIDRSWSREYTLNNLFK
jgi:hypothetical protein